MQTIPKSSQDALDRINIPEELRQLAVEIIIWPLTNAEQSQLNISSREIGKPNENLSNHH